MAFTGFPATVPSANTSNNVTITATGVSDNYNSSSTDKQGFYLNTTLSLTVASSGFVARNSSPNTVNCRQTFYNSTNNSASYSFYYETPFSSSPTGSINSISINSGSLNQISGIYVLYGTPQISVNATANNMGDYFYRYEPITYNCTIGSLTTTFIESTLLNATGYSGGRITNGTLTFTSNFNTNSLASVFSKTISVSASIKNINSTTSTSSNSINVITDGASNTFVYSTLSQTIQSLSSNTVGFRIWSAPSISNNCPNLKYSGTDYYNIPYNNSWSIASNNNSGYDATSELQVYNGTFLTPAFNSTNAYLNYSIYSNNSYNYSSIASETGYRFASFCWKIPQSSRAYVSISFTINSSVSNHFRNVNGGKITVNNIDLLMFYSIRDATTNNYDGTNINTVWINANSNNNPPTSTTYFLSQNTYGNLGGLNSITTPSINATGSTASFNVFVPATVTSNSTYLYFRIGFPMNSSLSFGTVTSSIST